MPLVSIMVTTDYVQSVHAFMIQNSLSSRFELGKHIGLSDKEAESFRKALNTLFRERKATTRTLMLLHNA